jgi:hypothetical protein
MDEMLPKSVIERENVERVVEPSWWRVCWCREMMTAR